MDFNFIEAITSQLSPTLMGRMGSTFGVNADSLQKLTQGGISPLVDGISHLGSTESGADKLMGLLGQTRTSSDSGPLIAPLDDLHAVSEQGQGSLRSIFGAGLPGMLGTLSNMTGVGAGPTSGVMGVLASIGLGVLGRHVRSNKLGVMGLSQLLNPRAAAQTVIPPVATARAAPVNPTVPEPRTYAERPPERTVPVHRVAVSEEHKKGSSRALPIILGLGALFLAWGLLRGRTHHREVSGRTPTAMAPSRPNDTRPAHGSPAYQLAQSLRGDSAQALPQQIPIRGLDFRSQSAAVPVSAGQDLASVGAVLKAYPDARIRIEAPSDTTVGGDASGRIGEERAQAIKNVLVSKGADPEQIETQNSDGTVAQMVVLQR